MTFSAGRTAWLVLGTAAVLPTLTAVLLLAPLGGWWWPLPPLGFFWCYVPFLVRSVYGECRAEGLYVRFGVVFRREMHVPFSTLRTYETWAPPLHTLCGCRTMVLRFAGGSVWLPFISTDTARRVAAYVEGRV